MCIEITQIHDLDAFNFLDFDIESILKDNNEVGLEFSGRVDATNGVVASHGHLGNVKSSLGFLRSVRATFWCSRPFHVSCNVNLSP